MNLYDALTQYSFSGAYPFHMPGHKRRSAHLCDPSLIDLTEIDGFDNLHHAEGILQEAQMRAAALYGSSETHFLVNGSTAGILSAIGACAKPGGCLVMARSSHRSAFHAVGLNRLRTVYLYPDLNQGLNQDLNGPISPSQVEDALLRHENVCAVFLTSPTYDGVVSDIAAIARIAHSHGAALIVDEAHGAHFGMHGMFPESSVKLGADLVIHSLHKTLPALTQTALIHVNGPLVDRRRLRHLLSVYQTSSPSYVLMASADQCIGLLSERGNALFDAYAGRLQHFYETTRLSRLSFLHTDDPSRILICPPAPAGAGAGGMNAMCLYHTLRERFRLQPEMVGPSCVLMLSSVCDDEEGFARLSEALLTLDRELDAEIRSEGFRDSVKSLSAAADPVSRKPSASPEEADVFKAQVCCTIAQAMEERTVAVSFSEAQGRISAEYLFCYPPGVPLLVPGERIDARIIHKAYEMRDGGYSMQGPEDHSLKRIHVIRE